MHCVPLLATLAVTLVTAVGATSDPGETAVQFLEKARAGNLNLKPGGDTALTPETGTQKCQEITHRLQRMARDIGKDPLEVFAVKTDDDLAAVLVRKSRVMNPDDLQIFPVALVMRDGVWHAAPVPASFENSGTGYSQAIKKRTATLQEWMLTEQARSLADLREQATVTLRAEISKKLPADVLRKLTSSQAADRFLAACENGCLPELLGLLGGLSETPADDWSMRARAAARAVDSSSESTRPWRVLVSKDVLRIIVRHAEEGNTARITVGCLDPGEGTSVSRTPRIEVVHLDLSKSVSPKSEFWRVDPPNIFLQDRGKMDDPPHADDKLLDEFTTKLTSLFPPAPLGTAQEASQAVIHHLEKSPLSALVPCIRSSEDARDTRKSLTAAARLWWILRGPASLRNVVPLAMHEDGDKAAGLFHFFSCRNPDHTDLNILYFDRTAEGWLWTPNPPAATEKAFAEWAETQTRQWKTGWQDALLGECMALETLPAPGTPVSREDATKLIDAWRKATSDRDLTKALSLTARLTAPDSKETLLRNLGDEMASNHMRSNAATIADIHCGTVWTAAGTRVTTDDQPVFPFYPIINTSAGPRILLEVDLRADGGRSRDFLNKTSFERLRKIHPEAADELQKLFADYQAEVTKSDKQK